MGSTFALVNLANSMFVYLSLCLFKPFIDRRCVANKPLKICIHSGSEFILALLYVFITDLCLYRGVVHDDFIVATRFSV